MKIDSGSLAFNINVNGKVGGTPSWGTAIVYQNEDNKIKEDIATDILIGMIYKKIDCTSGNLSLPLGKGGHVYHGDEDFNTNGAPSSPYLAARFEKTYVNGKSINKPFIMLIMKDSYDAHNGRLQLKYSPKITWCDYKNQEFFDEVFKILGISPQAPLICYAIDVIDQDSLHFSCAYKESEYKFKDSKELVNFTNQAIKEYAPQIELPPITDIPYKYRPYITAIKSKPFLLLAGISGTGKSRIVRELARACWEEGTPEYKAQKPKNFEMIQVKPNWHDSSELIGYVSRVSGTPEFVAGDFLKFVAKAWENPDVPHFLCLDEMNLAPVEQYFAEYLSVIESRKSNGNGTVFTDPILKKSTEDWYRVLTAELSGEDEALRNQFLEDGISIPQNLIVVGTVNMDETTFSFSRKVLDRAMTIEMNEVNLDGGLTEHYEPIGLLGKIDLVGTDVTGVDVYERHKDVCDDTIEYLKKVNTVLEGTPFKVAYRTRNEFLLYVANNLPYKKEGESDEFVIQRALDEITSMKVLSRIEGDETKVSREFLTRLEEVIRAALTEISPENSVSLNKLKEMKKRLESGYTSFWS